MLQMNEAAATVVVWVIGLLTVQNWRQYRISRPLTLDGVTTLLAMLPITKSCVQHCVLSGNKGQVHVWCCQLPVTVSNMLCCVGTKGLATRMLLTAVPAGKSWTDALWALVTFSETSAMHLLENVSFEIDFTHANTFITLKLILCVLVEFAEYHEMINKANSSSASHKIPTFYRTQTLTATCTGTCHLYWTKSIQWKPSQPISWKINFTVTQPSTPTSSKCLLSYTLTLCASLNGRDQVLCSYKTRRKIVVLFYKHVYHT
jgi:hypothetical protein